jgi:hypothetical protein
MLWSGLVQRRQYALAVAGCSLLRQHASNFYKLGIHSYNNPKLYSSLISLSGSRTAGRVANFRQVSSNTVPAEAFNFYSPHRVDGLLGHAITYSDLTLFCLPITPLFHRRAGNSASIFMARSTRAGGQRGSRRFHTSTETPSPAVADTTSASSNTTIHPLIAGPPSTSAVEGKEVPPIDPESDEEVPVTVAEVQDALSRPPPVNSEYLPLPWKGRLGYVSFQNPLVQ